ncbi:hypothetical protein EGR_11170 [Echinococcus granulosus]|uniref:Uncharacterized protein n=1 Tax=Echinococcus granulosus TaxID=6210 RepID=W6TZ33_ECHGR|nr:hypothetical protein EGR_11170 [Echinococcus granulosus]EUB53973.1 hypothetical protein EGR_11170 [Echinococcus granulosus]
MVYSIARWQYSSVEGGKLQAVAQSAPLVQLHAPSSQPSMLQPNSWAQVQLLLTWTSSMINEAGSANAKDHAPIFIKTASFNNAKILVEDNVEAAFEGSLNNVENQRSSVKPSQ